jgi:Dyp-type peroxidase family
MAISLTDPSPVDPENADYRALMENLQCNILKSHGRNATAHLFLRFTGDDPNPAKQWIRRFTDTMLTTAWQQHEQSVRFKEAKAAGHPVAGPLVGAFFLSADGYRFLGIDPAGVGNHDSGVFRKGMKHQGHGVNPNRDPEPGEWEEGFRGEVHAMVLLAHENRADVTAAEQEIENQINGLATIVARERGDVLRNNEPTPAGQVEAVGENQPIEHFGYVDGRSQPLFLKSDLEKETDTARWDPAASLDLILHPDPFGPAGSFGSFLVFRKLEQDVPGFNTAVGELADILRSGQEDVLQNALPTEEERAKYIARLAGAMVVGRFKDGTPLVRQDQPGLKDINDFEYRNEDPDASRCPMHAHIRKVNPRGTTPLTSLEDERSRRIARRGIPYGKRDGDNKRGLLFMCYQSNIKHQFEFIQRTWVDNPAFPKNLLLPHTGDDPLIGQDDRSVARQKWPVPYGGDLRASVSFPRFVTLKGGEYMFAPSVGFLKGI